MASARLIYRLSKWAGLLPFLRSRHLSWSMPGLVAPFTLRAGTSDVQTFRQVFIYGEYELALKRAPRVIVDAGANIGLSCLYFKQLYPGARILAVEPEASNVDLLRSNVAAYDDVEVIQAALWNRSEDVELMDPGHGHWGFRTGPVRQVGGVIRVRGITVDELMSGFGIDYIDYLKVDIEGAEMDVFAERPGWLDRVGVLVVELHDRDRPGCSEVFDRNTTGFDRRRVLGENVVLARREYLDE